MSMCCHGLWTKCFMNEDTLITFHAFALINTLFPILLGSQLAESEVEKLFDEVGVPLQITPASIIPFSFPSYKSPDTKDDMVC